MAENNLICPVCGTNEHIYKVRQLYLESLMRIQNPENAEAPMLDELMKEVPPEKLAKYKGKEYYRYVSEAFAPPQGGTQITRSINPDFIMVALGLISIFFLYQIYAEQPGAFFYLLGFVTLVFVAYIIFRKKIMAKYTAAKQSESGNKDLIEKAIGKWMKLYYCSQDNVVFGNKKGETIPLQEMTSYVLH